MGWNRQAEDLDVQLFLEAEKPRIWMGMERFSHQKNREPNH